SDIWFPMEDSGNEDLIPCARVGTMVNIQMYSHWDCLNSTPAPISAPYSMWSWTWTNCIFRTDYYTNMTLYTPPTPLHPAVVDAGTNIFKNCTFTVGNNASVNGGLLSQNWCAGIGVNGYGGTSPMATTNFSYEAYNCTFNINGPNLTNSFFVYY